MDEETKNEIKLMIEEAIKSHRHDGVLTQNVYTSQLIDPIFGAYQKKWSSNLGEAFTSVVASTNGITAVNVLHNVPVSIGAVFVISKDTTAATITVSNVAGTVCTIAKGTVAGVMTGATSLSNSSAHTALQVVSSSAGNAFVILEIQYENGFIS